MMENLKRFRIEFTVDVHHEGVTKDWDYNNDDIKDFALQELECMSPYPFDITFSEVDNPWHTGTPTEDGDYLIAFHPWGRKEKEICYMGLKWEEDHWYDPVTDYFSEPYLVAWQKIDPYKEKDK